MNEGVEETGPVLGQLNIAAGGAESSNKTSQTRITLTLDHESTATLPQEHKMQTVLRGGPAVYAFSDTNRRMACEGVVQHRLEVAPRGLAAGVDDAYRKYSRERNEAAAKRTRTTQVVTQRKITDIRQPVAAAEAERRRKAAEGKRAAMPAAELQALLFRLFERQAYWAFGQLQKQTSQPTQHLKTVLSEIAIQIKRGPYKDMWTLKPEFRTGGNGEQPPGDTTS
jgi:hypothetical protein